MNHFAFATPLRTLTFGSALTAFALSLCLLTSSQRMEAPAVQTTAAGTSPSYYAALADNHVVIYVNGRTDPAIITDIDVRTLPDADRNLLEQGLPLNSADDVNRLLEDYGS